MLVVATEQCSDLFVQRIVIGAILSVGCFLGVYEETEHQTHKDAVTEDTETDIKQQ